MSEGTPLRAMIWGLATAVVLLAWPWLLAWVQRKSPQLLAGTRVVEVADLGAMWRAAGRPRAGTLLAWSTLAVGAALLPAGNGWQAADLDAGLLWLTMLAFVALAGLPPADLRTAASPAAGALLAILLCLAPPVLHTASLHLGDLAVAQSGGLGNWFLLRDPCLLLAGAVYLLTAAAAWPPPAAPAAGAEGVFAVSLRLGLPLVLAHLFTVVYLGGWWSFMPALDGLTWLQTALKNLLVLALLVWLRRRTSWCAQRHLQRRLPLAALAVCLAAAAWLVISGAVL